MRIVVTSSGADLDAPASPVFGRCQAYVFVETDDMTFEAMENPAIGAASGAGIQAAQLVVERGAQAVVTGNVGPNAFNVFMSAGVPVYLFGRGTVREAAEAFKAGQLQSIAEASAQGGMGMGRGTGMGRGIGMGRRMQPGVGSTGQGYGRTAPTTPPSGGSREDEVAALKETAQELQEQLAQVLDRLDKLQGET
jgi:predicted Fe-Mo cluster-binding NifX family protein